MKELKQVLRTLDGIIVTAHEKQAKHENGGNEQQALVAAGVVAGLEVAKRSVERPLDKARSEHLLVNIGCYASHKANTEALDEYNALQEKWGGKL